MAKRKIPNGVCPDDADFVRATIRQFYAKPSVRYDGVDRENRVTGQERLYDFNVAADWVNGKINRVDAMRDFHFLPLFHEDNDRWEKVNTLMRAWMKKNSILSSRYDRPEKMQWIGEVPHGTWSIETCPGAKAIFDRMFNPS